MSRECLLDCSANGAKWAEDVQLHIPANVNTQSGHREHLSLPTHHEAGF